MYLNGSIISSTSGYQQDIANQNDVISNYVKANDSKFMYSITLMDPILMVTCTDRHGMLMGYLKSPSYLVPTVPGYSTCWTQSAELPSCILAASISTGLVIKLESSEAYRS